MPRIFLLSPANTGGERARLVLRDLAQFDLAVRLRREGAPLGDIFSFLSGLYFRGKMAYAQAFAAPPEGLPASVVITAGKGLIRPEQPVKLDELRELALVPVDAAEPRYLEPLAHDARMLAEAAGPECRFILLGSVASAKYVEPLVDVFGGRLLFPEEFVGRGDMSRGGLLLRCARQGVELNYISAAGAVRHGKRPPRLPRWKPPA